MSTALTWLPVALAALALLDLLRTARARSADRVRVLLDVAVTATVLVLARQVAPWGALGAWAWWVVVVLAAAVAVLVVRRLAVLPWFVPAERHPRRRLAVAGVGAGACGAAAVVLLG